jgi:hypothetical protein
MVAAPDASQLVTNTNGSRFTVGIVAVALAFATPLTQNNIEQQS